MDTTTLQPSDPLTTSTDTSENTIHAVTSAHQGDAEADVGATPPLPDSDLPPSPPPPPSRTIALAGEPPEDSHRPPRHPAAGSSTAWGQEVRLPSGPFGFEETGRPIFAEFARRESLFIQHRTVVERVFNRTTGCDELRVVTPSEFRSRLEGLGQLLAFRSDNKSRYSWRPSLCSEDNAKGLLGSKAAQELLPRICTVVSCPIAIGRPGRQAQDPRARLPPGTRRHPRHQGRSCAGSAAQGSLRQSLGHPLGLPVCPA